MTRLLVTKGYRGFQQRKIAHLGIAPFFHAMHIVAIDEEHQGKLGAFKSYLEKYGWDPKSVIAIGDGREELEAGRALGMVTIQTIRPGVSELDADHHCSNLFDTLTFIN